MRFFLATLASSFLVSMALSAATIPALDDAPLAAPIPLLNSTRVVPRALTPAAVVPVCSSQMMEYELVDLEHIGSSRQTDPNRCRADCLAFPRCNAFNYNRWEGGSCWFKHYKEGEPVNYWPTPGHIAHLIQARTNATCPLVYQRFPNANFPSADLVQERTVNDAACFLYCAGNKDCKAFTWNGGTCWMKSARNSVTSTPNQVSGLVRTLTPSTL